NGCLAPPSGCSRGWRCGNGAPDAGAAHGGRVRPGGRTRSGSCGGWRRVWSWNASVVYGEGWRPRWYSSVEGEPGFGEQVVQSGNLQLQVVEVVAEALVEGPVLVIEGPVMAGQDAVDMGQHRAAAGQARAFPPQQVAAIADGAGQVRVLQQVAGHPAATHRLALLLGVGQVGAQGLKHIDPDDGLGGGQH